MGSIQGMGAISQQLESNSGAEHAATTVEALVGRRRAATDRPPTLRAPSGFIDNPFRCVRDVREQHHAQSMLHDLGSAVPVMLLAALPSGIGGVTEQAVQDAFQRHASGPATVKAVMGLYQDVLNALRDRLQSEFDTHLSPKVDPEGLTYCFTLLTMMRDTPVLRLEMHRRVAADLSGARAISTRLSHLCDVACEMLSRSYLPVMGVLDLVDAFHPGCDLWEGTERMARDRDQGEDVARKAFGELVATFSDDLALYHENNLVPFYDYDDPESCDELYQWLMELGQRLRERRDFVNAHANMPDFTRLVGEMTDAEAGSPYGQFVTGALDLLVEIQPYSDAMRALEVRLDEGDALIDPLMCCMTDQDFPEQVQQDLLMMIQECGEQPSMNIVLDPNSLDMAMVWLSAVIRAFALLVNADHAVCEAQQAASAAPAP